MRSGRDKQEKDKEGIVTVISRKPRHIPAEGLAETVEIGIVGEKDLLHIPEVVDKLVSHIRHQDRCSPKRKEA